MVELKGEAFTLLLYDFEKLGSIKIEDKLLFQIRAEKGTEFLVGLNINEKKIEIEYYEKFHLKEKKFISIKGFINSLLSNEALTEKTIKKVVKKPKVEPLEEPLIEPTVEPPVVRQVKRRGPRKKKS